MGHHLNRLDAKGRVSIPAPFRAALRAPGAGPASGPVAVVLRPSHVHACLEGWPPDEFDKLAAPLQSMPLFSGEHDDLSLTIFGDAQTVESDREGRIVVPESLARHAALGESVAFMGMGRYFQIWEPEAAAARRQAARERARTGNLTLPAQRLPGTPTV
jgi:MraZ protein